MHASNGMKGFALVALAIVGCSAQAHDEGAVSEARLANEPCACTLEQVCEASTRACIARPQPNANEQVGEVVLLRQERIGDTTLLGKLGKAEANFHAHEPLPVDRRRSFDTDAGEKCFLEMDTLYPWTYGGTYWPSGPGLGAGNVSFEVAAASGPSQIELFPIDSSYGWGYFHGDTPPYIVDGSAHYPDFFSPAVLPPSATFDARLAGGPDVGVASAAGELPAAFSVDEPAIEKPHATASVKEGLLVRWSPPQPTAYMEIFVTKAIGGSFVLLSCKVTDDGQTRIPAAALRSFDGYIGLQLRRTTERYTKVSSGNEALPMHLSVLGRNARVGSVLLE
jgi:hypothetical protein